MNNTSKALSGLWTVVCWMWDCPFMGPQRAESHLQCSGSPWGSSYSPNVLISRGGRPPLMRINAGSDWSLCLSRHTSAMPFPPATYWLHSLRDNLAPQPCATPGNTCKTQGLWRNKIGLVGPGWHRKAKGHFLKKGVRWIGCFRRVGKNADQC